MPSRRTITRISRHLCLVLPLLAVLGCLDTNSTSDDLRVLINLGHSEAAIELLERKPNLVTTPIRGQSPLHISSGRGEYEIAKYLLDHGATVDVRNHVRQTPLHLAAQRGHVQLVNLLIERNADVMALSRDQGTAPLNRTPLHEAATGYPDARKLAIFRKQLANIARILVAHGADMEAKTGLGQTPLHVAADHDLPEVITVLQHAGANLEARDDLGMTPLLTSAYTVEESMPALQELVRVGADLHARVSPPHPNENALSLAARWAKTQSVEFLLQHNVPAVYGTGKNQRSVVDAAVQGIAFDPDSPQDAKRIQQQLGLIDRLIGVAKENAATNNEPPPPIPIELAREPYILEHLLAHYRNDIRPSQIEAAIESNTAHLRMDPKFGENERILEAAIER